MHGYADQPGASSSAHILVLGIGNVLLRDDGVGVRVVCELERRFGGDSRLRFVDGGTIGFMLSTFIGETPDLLVIDAVRMAEPPGCARCRISSCGAIWT